MTAQKKPAPPLHRRLGYLAFLMAGVGLMLLAVGLGESAKERIATFLGLTFLVLGIVFLVVAGGLDLHNRRFGEHKLQPPNVSEPVPKSESEKLTETERALITFLRMNEVSPDIVAEALREVLERKKGR